MTAIRLAAVQTALLGKSEYMADLFGFATSPAYRSSSSMFGFSYGGLDRNVPEVDDGFILDPRLGGEQDDAAEQARADFEAMALGKEKDAFVMFRETGKKIRNGQITAFLARSFKTQSHAFMSKIEAEIDADIRTIWTPTETNCFKRMKGQQLDEVYQDLLNLECYTDDTQAFIKLKKGEKAARLHKMFNDTTYQEAIKMTAAQKAKVTAWVPSCFS
jgi:ParB family chromosome partitioning protein